MSKETLHFSEMRNAQAPQRLQCAIRLLRVKDCSVQNGVFLLGAFFADNFLAHRLDFILASLTLSCLCLAYGYGLNEFFDELKDRLVDDARTAFQLHCFVYALLGMALVLSWYMSPIAFAIMALIGITVWLHSSPPFRLKRKLFWRLFLNSLGFGLFFLLGASVDDRLLPAEIAMGVFIFGLYLPLELIHVLAHMDSDRAKNLPTFALIHGERKTISLAIAFLTGLILYSGLLWQLKFASAAVAGWSSFHLFLLIAALMLFYKRDNSAETYAKLRLRTKIVCAIYGMGLLAILIGKV